MWRSLLLVLTLASVLTPVANAREPSPDITTCLRGAGIKFGVDWRLLQAIAEVESGLRADAIGLNVRHGKILSEDLGMMQINSSWLPVLGKMGITRKILLSNPCQNIHVGAWILAKNISQNGVNWTSVGAYNAGFKDANAPFRLKYAHKVYARYLELTGN